MVLQLIDRVQKTGVFSVLQSFQPIDWTFLFLILWGWAGKPKRFL